MGAPHVSSKTKFPVRCCIIVPMKATIARPQGKYAVFRVSSHVSALDRNGEIRTNNAITCNQTKGKVKVPVPIGISVSNRE